MKKTFDVIYYKNPTGKIKKFSHIYSETWEYRAYTFCPSCGSKGIWVSEGCSDYYVGEEHICIECEYTFHLPYSHRIIDDQGKQRVDALTKLPKERV